jgi:LysM repeat protein
MKARRWLLFIGLNIVVSVLTTLGVLSVKGELERVVIVTVTPNPTSSAAVPTAPPVEPVVEEIPSVTPPPPVEYEIQAGDTLGGVSLVFDVPLEDLLLANNLTEDDIINPGDVLIIPQGEVVTPTPFTPSPAPPTATPETPTPFPTETPTPPGPVEVRIDEVVGAGDLEREGIVLINRGRTVNLQGWTLGPADGDQAYVFPRLTLAQEVPVTLYTIAGKDSPKALHWGLSHAQWDESGRVIELRDAEGDLITRFAVP